MGNCWLCGEPVQGQTTRYCQGECRRIADNMSINLGTAFKNAKKQGLPATRIEMEDWIKTFNDFDGKCAYCLRERATDIDHFIPYCFGGGTTLDNCIPACNSCNSYKRDHHPDCLPTYPRKLISDESMHRVRAYLATRQKGVR